MVEGTVVKVIEGVGLPDPSLIGGVGRVVGHFKGDPIVNLRVRPTVLKGSCWCIPKNCLKEVIAHTGKVAWSEQFNSMIECVAYNDNDNWIFVLVDCPLNQPTGPYKAQLPYDTFKWFDKEGSK